MMRANRMVVLRALGVTLASAAGGALCVEAGAAEPVRRAVLFTGQTLPGMQDFEYFRAVTPIGLTDDASGLISGAIEDGLGGSARSGAMVRFGPGGDADSVRLLARQSFPVAADPEEVAWSLRYNGDQPALSRPGPIVLPMLVSRPFTPGTYQQTSNFAAMFIETPGGLVKVARTGEPAAGVAGAIWRLTTTAGSPQSNVSIDRSGRLCFLSLIAGSGITSANDTGVWTGPPEALSLRAREGSAIAGSPPDSLRTLVGMPRMNDDGVFVFAASVTTAAGTRDAIYRGRSDGAGLTAVVYSREASGLGAGILMGVPTIRDHGGGGTLFSTTLTGGGVTSANDDTLWLAREGSRELILREGDPAPGAGEGARFTGWGTVAIDDEGGVLVRGFTSTGVGGLWYRSRDGFEPLLLIGAPAPGLDGAGIADFLWFELGPAGDVAIEASLTGRYWFEDGALWTARRSPAGWRFTPLLLKGERLEFASNNARFVSFIGGWTAPNRFGELLVGAEFRDGSAAVIFASAGDCPADFDGDGFVDFFDQIAYTAGFEAGVTRADVNRDGFLDFNDYAAFLDAFQAGC